MHHPTYERVKSLCETNGTNISRLCDDITGSKGNTSTWKKGNIRNEYLSEIADRFNVTTDYLLGRPDAPNPSSTTTSNEKEAGRAIIDVLVDIGMINKGDRVPDELMDSIRNVLRNIAAFKQ